MVENKIELWVVQSVDSEINVVVDLVCIKDWLLIVDVNGRYNLSGNNGLDVSMIGVYDWNIYCFGLYDDNKVVPKTKLFEVSLSDDCSVWCSEKKLTCFGLDLVVLESNENIMLCVELRDFADILVESEDDKKGKDFEVRVAISVSWTSFVICDDSG